MIRDVSKHFLFATWEGGGNIPPVATLIRRLTARGHSVTILGDECTRAQLQDSGAAFTSWSKAPSRLELTVESDLMRDWEASEPAEILRRIISQLMCGNAALYRQDVLDELERRPADLIVTSEMLFGPMIAGEAAQVPVAALGCNIPIVPLEGVPPFGPGFAPARTDEERQVHAHVRSELDALLGEGLVPLNAARVEVGLEPLRHLWEQFANIDAYLVATAASFDFPAAALPANLQYVGPLMDEPNWADRALPLPDGDLPLVLVAFSTTYQAQEQTLQRVITALADLPVRGLVTTGPFLSPEALHAPKNVTIVGSAPHDPLMRQASAVVTHGGHGTVIRSLLAGTPLLCMPMGRDQNDNAVRVAERGAGLSLAPDASVAEIGRALTRLLEDGTFRGAAAALGSLISAEMSPERVADKLEEMAASRAAPVAQAVSSVKPTGELSNTPPVISLGRLQDQHRPLSGAAIL